LHLDLAAQVGFDRYLALQGVQPPSLIRDWLFSVAAFGKDVSRADILSTLLREEDRIGPAGLDIAFLNDLRDRILPAFMDACIERIDWGRLRCAGVVRFQS
jgi:hypothetical protein